MRDFVNPAFGNFPVAKVTRTQVKELLAETLKRRSPKHVEVLHAVVSGIFTDHIEISRCQYMVSETVKNGRFGLPKTGKRLIDLPESLTAKLEKHILQLRGEALRKGKTWIFFFLA